MSRESIKNLIFLFMGSLIVLILLAVYLVGNTATENASSNMETVETVETAVTAVTENSDDIIKFLGMIISILLGIITFLLAYYFKEQAIAYKELTAAIGDLRLSIERRSEWEENFEKRYEDRKSYCDKLREK